MAVRVLGVFAKQPVVGAVKTRLAAQTTPEWACDVAAAMLADTLDRVATIEVRRVIVFAPVSARGWFGVAADGRFELEPQAEGDLGQRLRHFFERQITQGADAVVAIGADSPTLPIACIEQAFQLLACASRDGSAEEQVALPAVASEQGGEGREQGHEQGGSLLPRQPLQRLGALA